MASVFLLTASLYSHSENGTRYFEEILRTGIKLIPHIGTFRSRTDQSGRKVLINGKRPQFVKPSVFCIIVTFVISDT